MRSSPLLPLVALLGLVPLGTACSGETSDPAACRELEQLEAQDTAAASAPAALEPGGIRAFASEAELQERLADVTRRETHRSELSSRCYPPSKGSDDGVAYAAESAGSAAPSASEGAPANETITNNQEAGVDEGGIVKNVGGSLVVLRQGRLYALDVAQPGAPVLTDSLRVARTDGLNGQVWYDEMLVQGDLVYVVGFRYGVSVAGESARGATEVDSFRLAGGKLVRLKSLFLESNDYYSGSNYASRLVGGKLAFYMPHHLRSTGGGALAYPRVLEGRDDGTFAAVGPVFGALDVSTSVERPRYPTFHTVVQCDLPADGSLGCHGRAVLGEAWREHYVSTDAVYLASGRHVYRFDLGSLDVTAHAAEGSALDALSFRQGEGALHVAVNQGATPKLLSLPLAAFDKLGAQPTGPGVALGASHLLTKNRFVGSTLVAEVVPASQGARYGAPTGPGGELVTVDTATGAGARRALSASVVRLEALGDGRALVATAEGAGGEDLALEAVSLADLAARGRVVLPGVRQGEGRTHGFFYKPGEAGAGRFGYAVVSPSGGSPRGYGNGVSNLGFFDVGPAGGVTALGVVSAGDVGTQCETSCTDWYGNTRPIFLGARVFALMGSELAEVDLAGGTATKGASAELRFQE